MTHNAAWMNNFECGESEFEYTLAGKWGYMEKGSAVVLESLVWSGYLPPNGSNWDQDQLVFSRKLNLTGPNQYKLVIVG